MNFKLDYQYRGRLKALLCSFCAMFCKVNLYLYIINALLFKSSVLSLSEPTFEGKCKLQAACCGHLTKAVYMYMSLVPRPFRFFSAYKPDKSIIGETLILHFII